MPATLADLAAMENRLMAELDDLTVQVKKNEEVEAAAVVLIQGIAAKLEAAKSDPIKIQALSNELKTSADALAAAVVANTPAE